MAGIYIHIPFCAKQCTYCDFHFSTTFEAYRDQLLTALGTEIQLRAGAWQKETIETIYFGGGTPSLLTGDEIQALLSTVYSNYNASDVTEITLECNPDDCSEERLKAWKTVGVNRLSIGIQSFTDEQLAWMNRTHTADEGLKAVERAIAVGFDQLTVDLMYGLPDLSQEAWLEQLNRVIGLGVNHISAYCLTIEEKTVLASRVKSGKIHPSTADQQSEQFELLVSTLAAAGFEQYEISNFARERHYSQHNTAYWQGKKYVAIGPSAHGFDGNNRYWNVANNQLYIQRIEKGILPETVENLTNHDRFNELLMVGLRTKWGVVKTELTALIIPDTSWNKKLESWKESGAVIETATHILLTPSGRLLADAIASDLFVIGL
ncbi:MAG: radical SAM family heme chaperone HemW [Bacteroidota bacterium]